MDRSPLDSAYAVAAEELVSRIKMREQLLLLNVTASLAVFGFAFQDKSPVVLLIIPHICFGSVVLFGQQHSIIGALFSYFVDLGHQTDVVSQKGRKLPWHASRFFAEYVASKGVVWRYLGRAILFIGPSIGALIFSYLKDQAAVRDHAFLWYLGLAATVAASILLYSYEFHRVSMYKNAHVYQFSSDPVRGDLVPPLFLSKSAFRIAITLHIILFSGFFALAWFFLRIGN